MQVDRQVKELNPENNASDAASVEGGKNHDENSFCSNHQKNSSGDEYQSTTRELCKQMNAWVAQKQTEIDVIEQQFNSESFLSSDSDLYQHVSEDAASAKNIDTIGDNLQS